MNESNEEVVLDTQQSLQNASEIFSAGGPVMYILLGLSIIAFTVILLKIFQFQYLGVHRRKTINNAIALWCSNDRQGAVSTLSKSRHPIAIVGLTAMLGLAKPATNTDTLREEVVRVGTKQMNGLNKGLWSLELISMVSPLLGLFGTVLGMIYAFKALQVAGAQVNPAILSGGIWQALLTTAAGLAVAIPVVMIFKWMERIINRVSEDMEDSVTQIFTHSHSVGSKAKTDQQQSVIQPAPTLSNA